MNNQINVRTLCTGVYDEWTNDKGAISRFLSDTPAKGPVIIYHLGGGGGEDFGGDHLIFRRTEGGISRNWEPKGGGSLKILEGFKGWTTQISLNNASLKAYNINVPILLGDDSICNKKGVVGLHDFYLMPKCCLFQ